MKKFEGKVEEGEDDNVISYNSLFISTIFMIQLFISGSNSSDRL